MPTHRIEKMSALLKREISQLINLDFAEEGGLITVCDIKLSADFKQAVVYITIFNKDNEAEILSSLGDKKNDYQHILGRKLKIKFSPRLTFKIDHSQEKIDQVDKLLKEIDHVS